MQIHVIEGDPASTSRPPPRWAYTCTHNDGRMDETHIVGQTVSHSASCFELGVVVTAYDSSTQREGPAGASLREPKATLAHKALHLNSVIAGAVHITQDRCTQK